MASPKSVLFYYSLNVMNVESERPYIEKLDWDSLKSIANGNIFIFFEPDREYIIIKTGIIDYLNQFDQVFKEIDSGNNNPFSVSCDFYSNSIEYEFNPLTNNLKISDTNDKMFEINSDYNLFKESYFKFRERTIREFLIVYPELKKNDAFNFWCHVR